MVRFVNSGNSLNSKANSIGTLQPKGEVMAKTKNVNEGKPVEYPPGVIRKTLSYNDEAMLCHFILAKGTQIPLHSHRASQIGYVTKGKAKFIAADAKDEFEALQGDSYVFDPHFEHGTIAIEETEYIEVFTPSRDEFKDF